MGWLDKEDLKCWIDLIIEHKEDLKCWIDLIIEQNRNSNIILHGSPMGAATEMFTLYMQKLIQKLLILII